MCAVSEVKIGDFEVRVYMGYYGGEITVRDDVFDVNIKDEQEKLAIRKKIKDLLSGFSSIELAELILELIENSYE